MKRLTLLTMLVALFSVAAFAQKSLRLSPQGAVPGSIPTLRCIDRQVLPSSQAGRRAAGELVTPPATATVETWYTVGGVLNVNLPNGVQQFTPDVLVAIDGNDIYIQGLAYWFKDGWIKGTIDGTTATFANGQYVGEDEYGPEYICGTNDAETLTDIVFNYNAQDGVLEAATLFIIEGASVTEVAPYCFWAQPVFSKTAPEGLKPVEAPEGLVTDEWAINAVTNFGDPVSGYVNIGFDGNDVYLQGLCTYLPESWIKGKKDGSTITFAGDQYFGYYDGGPMNSYYFFLRSEGIAFNYNAEAGTMAAEGEIYIYTGGSNLKGDVYNNPVLTKVVEKSGTPATPSISQVYDGTDAPVVMFTVPTVDVDGNGMASSKLTFQFLKDVEMDISPVTFEPAQYASLTETMSAFPYGYSNGDDFQPKYILLRQSDYNTWNRIGIQSIYTGGGEEKKSEVFWLAIKDYAKTTFDFNAMTEEPCSSNDSNAGDITADRILTNGEVTLTVSPNAEGTPNRFWSTNKGPQLRVYGGTLTFEAATGKVIRKIVFNNGKWNDNNSANTGAFDGATWTGEAQKVVVTIAGNTQLNSIDVFPTDFVPTAVEVPEGLVTDTYIFNAHSEKPYYEPADLTLWVKVGFDGDDAYIQGLAADYNSSVSELWVKATKNSEGKYVIPANQFMGSVAFWMSNIECYFTAVDAEGKMVDAVLDFDADKSQFSTAQTLVLNALPFELYAYETFNNVTITKFNEVAATPADPAISSMDFSEWSHGFNCTIPSVGTNGETLNPAKMFYTVWVEKEGQQMPYTFKADIYYGVEEDATEMPYSFDYNSWDGSHSIYFYDDAAEFDPWTKVGIQSIYYGAGEVHKSNIAWAYNAAYVPKEVVVKQSGYATFYDANHSFVIPEGIKAYVVTAATTEKLTYSELQGVIPAGTAVMLVGSAGSYPVVVSEEEAVYDGVNLLKGSNVPTTTFADVEGSLFYKLAYGHSEGANANKLGWYWGAENGAAFQIDAHRAWLAVPQTVASAPGYPFITPVTGISTTLAGNNNAGAVIYDLQGRRISTPAKGIYIKNNKKVIIK